MHKCRPKKKMIMGGVCSQEPSCPGGLVDGCLVGW